MSASGDRPPSAATSYSSGGGSAAPSIDPAVPLENLSLLASKMDSFRRLLSDSLRRHLPLPPDVVSAEISSAIHQVVLNGAALLASSYSSQFISPFPSDPTPASGSARPYPVPDPMPPETESDELEEIMEIDAGELMAEHVHFCEVCGKGFKRDANLRMHMRSHGDQFKTLEALSRPLGIAAAPTSVVVAAHSSSKRVLKFSCPFLGCNRNKQHRRFRPLKSVVCVKNHFKRSHCPKMYTCERCQKKSFSILADLKSHLKHCGARRWRCSCGTSFSRKDKLFGHVALFEGHKPEVGKGCEEEEEEESGKGKEVGMEEMDELEGGEMGREGFDDDFFEGLMDWFGGGKDDGCFADELKFTRSSS